MRASAGGAKLPVPAGIDHQRLAGGAPHRAAAGINTTVWAPCLATRSAIAPS